MKLMRSFVEGIHFYKTRKNESMAIIAKYMRTNDMEAVGATYDYFANKIVPKKPYPTGQGIRALLELAAMLLDRGVLPVDLRLEVRLESFARARGERTSRCCEGTARPDYEHFVVEGIR